MLTPEKTCDSVRAALFEAERHGGPMPGDLRTHLDACSACRTAAAELAETMRGTRSWAGASSTEVPERVLARLGPTIQKAAARARRPAWLAALRSPWSWAGAAVVVAAVLFVTFRPGDRPLDARVVASEGLVERSTPSTGDHEPLAAGALLGPRDRIRVGPSSRVVLRLGRERAVLLERTAVAIEQLEERAIRLHLGRGKIAVAVRPDPQHSSGFSVSTARAEVIVTGTLFDVHSDEEQTQVTVARGTVEVRVPDRAPARVEAGFSLTVAAGRVEVRRAEPEVLAVLTALFAANTRTSDPPRPDAGGRVDEPATPSKAGAGGRRERDRDELGEVEALAIRGSCRRAAEQAARLRSGSGAGLRAEAHMVVADCHHAAGQLETALELYREVATDYARTAAGQNAAYEAARLAQKLG